MTGKYSLIILDEAGSLDVLALKVKALRTLHLVRLPESPTKIKTSCPYQDNQSSPKSLQFLYLSVEEVKLSIDFRCRVGRKKNISQVLRVTVQHNFDVDGSKTAIK